MLQLLSKRRRKIAAATLLCAALAVLIGGGYLLRTRYIKFFGVELAPSREFAARELTYYLQTDPEWGADLIGNSRETMSSSGCLISCVASVMGTMEIAITPGELNARLTEAGGFEKAVLIWYKIHEAVPEADYRYSRAFSSATIDSDLENGDLPIVKVRYKGGFAQHWVVIVGAEDGEYLIYDPLEPSQKPVPLSRHGRVYAYRVLLPAEPELI